MDQIKVLGTFHLKPKYISMSAFASALPRDRRSTEISTYLLSQLLIMLSLIPINLSPADIWLIEKTQNLEYRFGYDQ